MTQPFRLAAGGIVDRMHPLRFMFDGAPYEGYAGDTLASALIANGVHLVGRSFKYHRPRGIYSAGAEEPSALVQLARGARTEPNMRATTVELHDGLVADQPELLAVGALRRRRDQRSRCRGSFPPASTTRRSCGRRRRRGGCATSTGSGAPPAWAVRRRAPDPDRYDHRYAHCDVLVVGGGLAGTRRRARRGQRGRAGSSSATRIRAGAAASSATT